MTIRTRSDTQLGARTDDMDRVGSFAAIAALVGGLVALVVVVMVAESWPRLVQRVESQRRDQSIRSIEAGPVIVSDSPVRPVPTPEATPEPAPTNRTPPSAPPIHTPPSVPNVWGVRFGSILPRTRRPTVEE